MGVGVLGGESNSRGKGAVPIVRGSGFGEGAVPIAAIIGQIILQCAPNQVVFHLHLKRHTDR